MKLALFAIVILGFSVVVTGETLVKDTFIEIDYTEDGLAKSRMEYIKGLLDQTPTNPKKELSEIELRIEKECATGSEYLLAKFVSHLPKWPTGHWECIGFGPQLTKAQLLAEKAQALKAMAKRVQEIDGLLKSLKEVEE